MSDRKVFNPDAIRSAVLIPDLLTARGWPLKKSSDGWRGPCPVHKGEGREAFHVFPDGQRWHCHSKCGEGGDVISLVQRLDGMTFPQACEALGGKGEPLGILPPPKRTQAPQAPPLPLPELDAGKRREMATIATRLADDDALTEALALSRGEHWEPVTIRALAYSNALGWLDAWPWRWTEKTMPEPAGVICFLFPSSVKIRALWKDDAGRWLWHWPVNGEKEKIVRWLWRDWPWNKAELWREDRLRLLLRTDVAVTEGEPDAIRLINAGAEIHARTICAIPDASPSPALTARLPGLLAGLNVTYFADRDAAGLKAAAKIRETIASRVARLAIKHLAP